MLALLQMTSGQTASPHDRVSKSFIAVRLCRTMGRNIRLANNRSPGHQRLSSSLRISDIKSGPHTFLVYDLVHRVALVLSAYLCLVIVYFPRP
jgi:hypothetical protein